MTGTLELARTGAFTPMFVLFLFIGAIAITFCVVFVERGQRRITVNYAKRQQGRKMLAGQSSHLPLKLNMAGVIPPIFASSLILFPCLYRKLVRPGRRHGLARRYRYQAAAR